MKKMRKNAIKWEKSMKTRKNGWKLYLKKTPASNYIKSIIISSESKTCYKAAWMIWWKNSKPHQMNDVNWQCLIGASLKQSLKLCALFLL